MARQLPYRTPAVLALNAAMAACSASASEAKRLCFGGLCVYEMGLLLLFVHVALLLLLLSLFLWVGAHFPSLASCPYLLIQARRAKKSFYILVSICRAKNDPPVTKIRLWASFGV